MTEVNYFQVLCLFWATLGIGSRILMGIFGERWKRWELGRAYARQKPKWLYVAGTLGLALIAYTWYAAFTLGIDYGWIMAVFVSLTSVKMCMLIFRYDRFRTFAVMALNDRLKMRWLNAAVLFFSVVCIWMAFYLY